MNKNEIIWNKLQKNKRFHKLVGRIRKEWGMPEDGYGPEKYSKWFLQHYERLDEKSKSALNNKYSKFLREVNKIVPMTKLFKDVVLQRYVFFNDSPDIDKIDFCRFRLMYYDNKNEKFYLQFFDGKIIEPADKPQDSGTYLYIDPHATITDIKQYITDNKKKIFEMQSMHIKKEKLSFIGNLRRLSTVDRNKKIKKLNKLTKIDLQKRSGKNFNNKITLISVILLIEDGIDVSHEAIKNVLYRN